MIKQWLIQHAAHLLLSSEPSQTFMEFGKVRDYIAYIDRHTRKCVHCGSEFVMWAVIKTSWVNTADTTDHEMDRNYTPRTQSCLSRPLPCELWHEVQYNAEMSWTLYRS